MNKLTYTYNTIYGKSPKTPESLQKHPKSLQKHPKSLQKHPDIFDLGKNVRKILCSGTVFRKMRFTGKCSGCKKSGFFKKLFSKKTKLDILKMSKNQIFKILFDKKSLIEIFHGSYLFFSFLCS